LDVGARLQTIRTLKGLSQRELAKRAGVTNSTISMIEKNSVSRWKAFTLRTHCR